MLWNNLWQRSEGPRLAVFSDIDNTFYRPDCASDSQRLARELAERNMLLVAVTGAKFSSVHGRILCGELPPFAVVASCVGTEISVLENPATLCYQDDLSWAAQLRTRGFDHTSGAVLALRNLVDVLRVDHPEWGVVLQGGDTQRFKFSLHYRASSTAEAEAIAVHLGQVCGTFRTVWCQDINFLASAGEKKRYCFDVLACDKRDAVDYLVAELGVHAGLVCGDSGNDATMILSSSEKLMGVVVGGSQAELLQAVARSDVGKVGKRVWVETQPNRLGPQSLLAAVEEFF